MSVEIKLIAAPETYALRKQELRKNMTLSEKIPGDFEESTLHLGLYENNKLACIATFMPAENDLFKENQYRLRGMATDEKHQKKGYGKAVLLKAEEILKEKGIDLIWCNARVVALDFYKKLGYEIIGGEFDIPQIGGHYVMFKNI
ncbi:GNAT family N-acetyltransferase [Namhaeicola litoreus]|uniref:GNAT family N-acetyltransferase n=1 Tax=Namhaeicola litoreus TaxID=1052145 RepID=A0ABW3Y3K0_9FLAO